MLRPWPFGFRLSMPQEAHMATVGSSARSEAAYVAAHTYPAGGLLLDWAFSFLSIWLVGGSFLDGWAHTHGRVDDVFFTPWHAVLYSGALAIMLLLAATCVRNMALGYAGPQVLPAGYLLSLIGAALFLIGGAFDMLWHILFGIEVSIEALLSPSHLLLATSGVLMIGAPLRAAARRPGVRGWLALGPMLLSATLSLSILTFFTQFAHPLVETIAAAGSDRSLGVSSVLIQSALLVGVILLLVRRWALPLGALTLLIGLNGAMMSVFEDTYNLVPAALAAGILADLLLRWLRPSEQRRPQLYLFAFVVPALFYGLYFLALYLTSRLVWSISLWTGAVVLAGFTGLFVSFLIASPLRSDDR
jgi:hypothetical protein